MPFSSTIPFLKPCALIQLQCTMPAHKQLFSVNSSVLCCFSFCLARKKRLLKPEDLFTGFGPQVTSCKKIFKRLGKVRCQAECLHQAVCIYVDICFFCSFLQNELNGLQPAFKPLLWFKSERFKFKTGE